MAGSNDGELDDDFLLSDESGFLGPFESDMIACQPFNLYSSHSWMSAQLGLYEIRKAILGSIS